MNKIKLCDSIEKILKDGYCYDENNNKKIINDSLSYEELKAITIAMKQISAKVTVETGVANGLSTLAICDFLRNMNSIRCKHYGTDPNQKSDYGNSAIQNLTNERLLDYFTLMEGPSHLKLPELIKNKIEVDFALVDGWHTFDYTLLDFFLIDKLLKVNGIIAFHDCHNLAKQKVLRYIETHRKYIYRDDLIVKQNESFFFTFKFFIWRLLRKPRLLFSKYFWKYQFKNSSGLVFLQKVENYEPNFDFYKNF
jgi:predicted O-methyltransferase YrrM